jgi:hypothetical protein
MNPLTPEEEFPEIMTNPDIKDLFGQINGIIEVKREFQFLTRRLLGQILKKPARLKKINSLMTIGSKCMKPRGI